MAAANLHCKSRFPSAVSLRNLRLSCSLSLFILAPRVPATPLRWLNPKEAISSFVDKIIVLSVCYVLLSFRNLIYVFVMSWNYECVLLVRLVLNMFSDCVTEAFLQPLEGNVIG